MLIYWVALINPNDLHALALTNSLLFREAEKYRWNTVEIKMGRPDVEDDFMTGSRALCRVEGRLARVTHFRLRVYTLPFWSLVPNLAGFVRQFFKEARGLRTLHFHDTDSVQAFCHLVDDFVNIPFKLTELAILSGFDFKSAFMGFIVSQPTIERLSMCTIGSIVNALPDDALPNLAAVSADSTLLARLVEGRPVKYLRLETRGIPLPGTLQTLETTLQKSTQPITAISLVGSTMDDIVFFLNHLLRLVPGLRFLGCEWFGERASDRARDDLGLLRSFTKLECIRWRCGEHIPTGMQRLKWRRLNPRNYAGPSLRAVQQESTCTRPTPNHLARVEGMWHPSEDQSDCWYFRVGEFLAPPLVLDEPLLVRIVPADDLFGQVTHVICLGPTRIPVHLTVCRMLPKCHRSGISLLISSLLIGFL